MRQLVRVLGTSLELADSDLATIEAILRQPQDPRSRPSTFEALQRVGSRDEANVLVVVDPLEELLSQDAESVRQFFRALSVLQRQGPVLYLAAIRSEFLPTFERHATMADLAYNPFYLKALAESDLREVISAPAARAGVVMEPELVDALIAETETEDALPLLAHSLQHLWDEFRDRASITLGNYRELFPGGLGDAIAGFANRVISPLLAGMNSEEVLRRAILTMVRINENGDYVRQPVPWSSIPDQARPFIDALVTQRLCVEAHHKIKFTFYLDSSVRGYSSSRADCGEAVG